MMARCICGAKLEAPGSLAEGKTYKCPKCGNRFIVELVPILDNPVDDSGPVPITNSPASDLDQLAKAGDPNPRTLPSSVRGKRVPVAPKASNKSKWIIGAVAAVVVLLLLYHFLPSFGSSGMTYEEFRSALLQGKNQVVITRDELKARVGKPSRKMDTGDTITLYYDIRGGTVMLEVPSGNWLRRGEAIIYVNSMSYVGE